MTVASTLTPTMTRARRTFWVFAALGIPTLAVAWSWYGLAMFEAESEQGKALSAGTTMAGFGEFMGIPPLVLAHAIGLAILLPLGFRGWRGTGLVLVVAAVAAASLVGIGVAQLLWEGQLFEHGINHSHWVP